MEGYIYAAHDLPITEDNNSALYAVYIIVLCIELSCVGSHAWAFMYGFVVHGSSCMGSSGWALGHGQILGNEASSKLSSL